MGERGKVRKIRIGISACLLGERVRWNGDHKREPFLVDTVGKFCANTPSMLPTWLRTVG